MAVLPHEGTHSIMFGSWPIPIGAGQRTAYLARPDAAGRFPAVVVLPTLDGLTGFEKDLCRSLARTGIVGVGIDFYREQGDPLEQYAHLTDTRAMTDLDEAGEFLRSDDVHWVVEGNIGLLGLDVGGRFALIAAATREWVGSVVAAYTPLTGDDEREHPVAEYLSHMPVPVLGLFGAEDDLIDVSTVDEAQRRNDHGQWLLYEGAGHDFLDVDAAGFHEDSAADARARIIDFFHDTLPKAQEIDLG
ncbi:MAG: alpha/beta family hydrolase [Acidimicrobiia bacterium]